MANARLLLTVMLATVIAAGTAFGQDVSEKPEGIICQPPQCDLRRSIPISLEAPLQAQAELVSLVRNTSASLLDPRLPPMPFDGWLFAVLDPHVTSDMPTRIDWALTFCNERRSAVPRAGPDLCIEASTRLSAKRTVTIMIEVAEGTSALSGKTGWTVHEPVARDMFVEHLNENTSAANSLDVAALSDLEKQVDTPFEDWPSVDLKSAVTWTPSRWQPGDVVHFTIWVENHGTRDAERAWVNVLLAVTPLNADNYVEIRREWFPRVPAKGRMGFEISARLPRGGAIAHVSVRPAPGLKRVLESNPGDNDTAVVVSSESDVTRGHPH